VGWLSENIDELIALILVLTVSIESIILVIEGDIVKIKELIDFWSPLLLPVIGFYFGSKTSRRAYRDKR
jgi:hypothetical protein